MEEENRDYQTQTKNNKKGGFAQYALFPQLYLNVMINKLKAPTQVQKKVIPFIMEGKDVVVSYKTGSGKTLAYLLPLINKLQSHSQIVGARALILIPTRDLADQITGVLKSFLHKIDLRYSLILGGHDYKGQFQSLSINPDIIIATPGRLMQLLTQTDLRLGRIQTIIFDQADNLFGENRFQKELKQILSKCPTSQRLMFSATMTQDIRAFANAGLRQYTYIHQQISLPETMKLDFFVVRPEEKISALLYVLDKVVKKEKIIIFASTRFHVDYLLSIVGVVHQCFGVYGKMDMDQRAYNLESFKKRKGKAILIVTDVAARGLDIPSVKYVVHYDYPSNHQIFVHRSGRTARAQQQGNTIAFVTFQQLSFMTELATFVTKKLTNDPAIKDSIHFGTLPNDILMAYTNYAKQLKQRNDEVQNYQKMANRAFQKFKKCRTQTSQYSLKKAKNLNVQTHYLFKGNMQQDQADFLLKIKNFNPKKSFLELQKISQDKQPENDHFLAAVDKIRRLQAGKLAQQTKRDRLKASNSSKWKQILTKNEIKQFQRYRQQLNSQRLPISLIDGVEIQLNQRVKKSMKKDFKDPHQYISGIKIPGTKTQFDSLPKIKTNQMEDVMQDENIHRKKKSRVWDKTKKNFVWQKDAQDKMSKDQKGKKAYTEWKKKSKLSIPKVGQDQDQKKTNIARQNWSMRRKFRHGWRDQKEVGAKGSGLKNKKTQAFQKKLKTKLIQKASKGGPRGGSKGGFKGKSDGKSFKGGARGGKSAGKGKGKR